MDNIAQPTNMSADANGNIPTTEMTGSSPDDRSTVDARNNMIELSCMKEQAIHHQILQLKKHQQLQHQILLQHFHAQQRQLVEQHEEQLRQHLKDIWEKQRELEEREMRERRELERIELLRRKEKHEESAIASSEVKQKLQGFLLNKKHREAAAASTSSQNQNILQSEPNVASGKPYCVNSLLGKFDEEYPLRKTASESNLLRMRRRPRIYERRCSPLACKKESRPYNKRKSHLAIDVPVGNADSGSSPPPVLVGNSQISPPVGPNAPIQEETEPSLYNQLANNSSNANSSIPDIYSSPSLPNISLGRPPSTSDGSRKLAPVSEAEIRAAFTARLGMPLTGHLLPTTLPYYPTLPGIETVAAEYSNSTTPAYVQRQMQMQSLEQHSGHQKPPPPPYLQAVYESPAITDSQVAHAHLNKHGHRPLGRTQSAPLPLGHPMLTAATSPSGNLMVHYEHSNEQQQQQQQHMLHELQHQQQYQQQVYAHNYLKQQIRQTVLTRAESRNHLNCTISKPNESGNIVSEVIDLTNRNSASNASHSYEHTPQQPLSSQQQAQPSQLEQQINAPAVQLNMFSSNLNARNGRSLGGSHIVRPLARAFSSPLVAAGSDTIPHLPSGYPNMEFAVPLCRSSGCSGKLTTALAFDSLMLKHSCICGDNSIHPEHGGRLQSVWARLVETGLASRCDRLRSRKASLEELQMCHTEAHTVQFGTTTTNRPKMDMNKLSDLIRKSFVRLPCGGIGVDSDTTWNESHTAPAARMAVGCVTDLAFKAAGGDIKNGFAIVRPPGHHAERSTAMGFCFFNSVAIAAKLLQHRLDLKRILILDWDVHHGNGTQQIFYEDRRVLYLSLHRHDDGNFFPGTGASDECGNGSGLGYNVNIAWSGGLNPPMSDAEYLAAFRTVVMPIAREYVPDIVLVSAGFDAASGHPPPLGGYNVSPACFGYMTQQLSQLADGRVILALEGGYDLAAICDCSEECVRALLDNSSSPINESELTRPPCQNAIDTLTKTITIQAPHWPVLKKLANTISYSAVDATCIEENETVTAMASLSMNKRTSEHFKEATHSTVQAEPMEQDEMK